MSEGARKMGIPVRTVDAAKYTPGDEDVLVFYGQAGRLRDLLRERPSHCRHAVFVDLGYWGRSKDITSGYHRVIVDAPHPASKIHLRPKPRDRLSVFNLRLSKPRVGTGNHLLICGQSIKAAWACGAEFEGWERQAVSVFRTHSARPVLYRPKFSAAARSTRLTHTQWGDPNRPIEYHLDNAWAVAAHHSNACLDALAAGIPVFCAEGAALPLGSTDLTAVEKPRGYTAEERDQLFADLAYCQWLPHEMESGATWRHLLDEGLLS